MKKPMNGDRIKLRVVETGEVFEERCFGSTSDGGRVGGYVEFSVLSGRNYEQGKQYALVGDEGEIQTDVVGIGKPNFTSDKLFTFRTIMPDKT